MGMALLHLPKMSELRCQVPKSFVEYEALQIDAIPYTDKKRENERLAKLKAPKKEKKENGTRVFCRKWNFY